MRDQRSLKESMENLPILTSLTDGQSYIDDPVYVGPAPHLLTKLADALAEIYGHVYYVTGANGGQIRKRSDVPEPLLVRYNHVKLRWMKPGADGKLIPR